MFESFAYDLVPDDTNGSLDVFVRSLDGAISGRLELEGIDLGALSQPVSFQFRPDTGEIQERIAYIRPFGSFSIPDVPRHGYIVHLQCIRYLATNVPVDAAMGSVTGVTATLLAGDANQDNTCDVLDLDELIRSFDRCEGVDQFNTIADFNFDGCVDVLDLDLLIHNFDKVGDE